MTRQAASEQVGREPYQYVEIDLGACSNVYGVAPCTAAGAVGTECYNTLRTCQDSPNYANTFSTIRFLPVNRQVPANLFGVPSLVNVDLTPSTITPGQGLGARASVIVSLKDQSHNDRGFDPYVATRPYDPLTQGTLFGRLKARNPFYLGRALRYFDGYLVDGVFDEENFVSREYIIEQMEGPERDGGFRIRAKDILKKADAERAVCPPASSGQLNFAIDETETTIEVLSGQAADYLGDYVRIGNELILLGSLSGDAWSGCTRGALGSTAESHQAGAAVQDVKSWVDVNVVDIIEELLTDYAGIDPSWIDSAQWAVEKAGDLSSFAMTAHISKPEGVDTLISELLQQCLIDPVVDEVDRKIRLVTSTPWKGSIETLTDEAHLLRGTIRPRDRLDLRLSRVWVYYGLRNYADDLKAENFQYLQIRIADQEEEATRYGEPRTKTILSRWMDSSNESQVSLLTGRLIGRFRDAPIEVDFELDARHSDLARPGYVVELETARIQGVDGSPAPTRVQITKEDIRRAGSHYGMTALGFQGVPETELVISVDSRNVRIADELSNPPEAVNVIVTLEAGVTVTGTPAISDAGLHPNSTVRFVCYGKALGDGGAAGDGDSITVTYDAESHQYLHEPENAATPGGDGQDALEVSVPWTVEVLDDGLVAGGGGGGGGGGALGSEGTGSAGGGGGGARGGLTTVGGAGGDAISGGLGTPVLNDGQPGENGGPSAAGAGGDGGIPGTGDGGDGGDFGEPGEAGHSPEALGSAVASAGAPGGEAGYAMRILPGGSVNITAGNDPTHIKGAIGA